jgi:hypothetical protein
VSNPRPEKDAGLVPYCVEEAVVSGLNLTAAFCAAFFIYEYLAAYGHPYTLEFRTGRVPKSRS